MKLETIIVAVLEKYASKDKPINSKELHYLAEKMFSSQDYNPVRAAGYSPEKSIASQVGIMTRKTNPIVCSVKQHSDNGYKTCRYYCPIIPSFGNVLVTLEDGTQVRGILEELD